MSSRYLHPIACRLPRKEKNAIDEIARTNKMSVSALTKEALRRMLFGVHPGVNNPLNIAIQAMTEERHDKLSNNQWSDSGRNFVRVPLTPLKKSAVQPMNFKSATKGGFWRD